jgi:transcription elongation factor S-II
VASIKAPPPVVPVGKRAGPRTAQSDSVKFPTLGDSTRDKCRVLIYDALVIDSGARTWILKLLTFTLTYFSTASDLIMSRATAVEEAVLNNCNGEQNADYRQKMRSLYLNLKGKENPSLREGVVSGDISPKKLAVMTSAVRHSWTYHISH